MTPLNDARRPPGAPDAHDPNSDLGFGSIVARESRQRFLNRDGSFNVRREGLGFWQSLSAYHYFLTIGWGRFISYLALAYILANAFFAWMFVLCGPGALSGPIAPTTALRFQKAFFFSVHTLATIGYGNVAPATLAANILVTVEALVGLVALGMIAGVIFARFARPVAKILFSESAVIAPYPSGGSALMFRIVNQKSNQIVNIEAKVLLTRRKAGGGAAEREFINLRLERDRVVFFPLAWTVVHPIDDSSPLFGVDEQEFRATDPELLVLLNGFDETFSQTVHARSSYKGTEIEWGARFRTLFLPLEDDGGIRIDVRRLHEIDRVNL